MIKLFLHKTLAILLVLLILFSTVSFTIEKHYCCDVLIEVSVFKEIERCKMDLSEILQEDSCCKHEVDFIKGQDELKMSSLEDFDFEQQKCLAVFFYSSFISFKSLAKQIIPHKDYSPPNLIYDIQVLDQVFII